MKYRVVRSLETAGHYHVDENDYWRPHPFLTLHEIIATLFDDTLDLRSITAGYNYKLHQYCNKR